MSLQDTPAANRLHIALFGRRNTGKSSLINALAGQQVALVSDVAGTTTDPVYKNIELSPIGPCVLIDTAGYDDKGRLGEMRVEQTKKVLEKTDFALVLLSGAESSLEEQWLEQLKNHKIPYLLLLNKADLKETSEVQAAQWEKKLGEGPLLVSAKENQNIEEIKKRIAAQFPDFFELEGITAHLVEPQDVVMLIMPQDIQAPKGRLILPQVQTIRDLLDHKCVVVSVTTDQLDAGLAALKKPPKLMITDSQVFKEVYAKKPEESLLTSFSVLFARYKGDIQAFVEGAKAIDALRETSRVLIAEACTHNPQDGDIGRVKIPALLRKKAGQGLQVDVVAGNDFPADLSPYQLVIHCGGCMFNRKHVLNRVARAQAQNIPITNYGVAIAKLTGILDQITVF